jgi:hypothetical protein
MKFKTAIAAAFAVALSCVQAFGQATLLPNPELCFQFTTGINGMVGVLGTITGGSGYTNGTYGGVSLTGGSGSNATANITVSGGIVTEVAILNPGVNYVVGDVLSAPASSIGGTGSGFSVPVNSTTINSAVAGGAASFLVPNTLTPKQTWQNAGETVLNQNPVTLDSNGCAIVYGAGTYRVILKDSLGNTVFDQLTAATNGANGIFWAALAGGTGNAITVIDTNFALQDGYNLQFLALDANTGPAFISVSGGTQIQIVKDTSTGPAPLTGGEIGPGNTPMLTYDATNAEFHLVNPAAVSSSVASSSITPPQGYLNLVGQTSGDVIQVGDVIGASTIFYSPFTGNQIPIWNGSSFVIVTFSELTATITSSGSTASTIQDECVFSNNGVPTLVTGPSWTTVTPGAGSRGTGAGSAQIIRLNGIWVNANSITGYNGLSSFTIAANECTYVGSILVDTTAGQVSAFRSIGQARKWGIWNAYNRQRIVVQLSDPTASWTDGGVTWHQTHGVATNNLMTFTGLPEEEVMTSYEQFVNVGFSSTATLAAAISIGINEVTSPSGTIGDLVFSIPTGSSQSLQGNVKAEFILAPNLGANVLNALSNIAVGATSTTQPTFFGAQFMLMYSEYRG